MAITQGAFYDAASKGSKANQRFYSNRRVDAISNQNQVYPMNKPYQEDEPVQSGAGRKTFYISDYHKVKQQREWE